ncbi:sugar ABC transporter permease (plasmid) [Deinococcus aetherius]|uniref:Sugar ABC transporter permease n=1 Tax=Deinococcus aetherius TaxID=200252 RepID=A0ABM8AIW0_9DEIO|nr:carbohydrate ABC transporter permease [Deinococcus aetherius]BDP43645.1 sugar ABC transporter permease [Deinococcus aetherius]
MTLRAWERRLTPGQVLVRVGLGLIFLVTAYPFVYVFSLAVMPYENFVRQSAHFLPSGFTLTYFGQVLSDPRLAHAFGISALKTVVGTVLSVVATVAAGWALSRPELRYGRLLTALFIVPLFVGGGLIPYFLVIRATGLLNTFGALVVPGLVASFNLLVVRSYFQSYPQAVLDAATVDGASAWTTFWRVVWPTSTPIIATVALLSGVGHWNEYFWPSLLVQSDLSPAQVVLQNLAVGRSFLSQINATGAQAAPESLIAAVAAIMVIPVLIVYPFLQRFVVSGILIGSVKE